MKKLLLLNFFWFSIVSISCIADLMFRNDFSRFMFYLFGVHGSVILFYYILKLQEELTK